MQKDWKLIWFDFDNPPHVPVLLPIIREMRNRGYGTILTARDKSETIELLSLSGEEFTVIGKSFPKNKILKVFYTFKRALRLISYLKKSGNGKINLFVSHGSRSALLASWLRRIPSVILQDYEFVNSIFQNIFASKILMPRVFSQERLKEAGIRTNKIDFYPGIKEQIYIDANFNKEKILEQFGVDQSKIIITLRPPSLNAHYHNKRSETIMREIFNKISSHKEKIFLIIFPRTKDQGEEISHFLRERSISNLIPEKPLNGINLILHSDLVLCGGGTMSREAAVLGVPSYSFFKGTKGAVDEFLEKKGRLIFIDSLLDVEKIQIKKKQEERNVLEGDKKEILSSICDQLESLMP